MPDVKKIGVLSPGSFVTTTEYMRAVAIARIAAVGVPTIQAPLMRLPTLSPVRGLGTASTQHPAEKIASLCLLYGADDLGPIDVEKLSPLAVMKQIRAAGFLPQLRDGRFGSLGNICSADFAPQWEAELRHVPLVARGC